MPEPLPIPDFGVPKKSNFLKLFVQFFVKFFFSYFFCLKDPQKVLNFSVFFLQYLGLGRHFLCRMNISKLFGPFSTRFRTHAARKPFLQCLKWWRAFSGLRVIPKIVPTGWYIGFCGRPVARI